MTGMEDMENTRFNIRDGHRPLTFLGRLIARADSQSGEEVRWTELTLYTTVTGKYVLENVGRSDVYHVIGCSRGSKAGRYESLDESIQPDSGRSVDDLMPCEQCHPEPDASPVAVERDLFSAQTYATADELVDAMHRPDNNHAGKRYLSRLSRALLEKASATDENIARVMSTPADIT